LCCSPTHPSSFLEKQEFIDKAKWREYELELEQRPTAPPM
jgi:hypothetical protein